MRVIMHVCKAAKSKFDGVKMGREYELERVTTFRQGWASE